MTPTADTGRPAIAHARRIASAPNETGYRTSVPYLRGYHLDTLVPDRPYDALHLAEDAIGLLDALELKSAVLAGHDWGATVRTRSHEVCWETAPSFS